MNFFDKLFGSSKSDKNENPYFTLFKGVFPKGTNFTDCKIYHIKSFEYTDANMKLYENNKYEKDFYKTLEKLEYNSQTNSVGLYYVIDSVGNGVCYLLADPYELLEREYIMEKYERPLDVNLLGLSTVEQIYGDDAII